MGRNFENRKNAIFKTAAQKSKLYSKYGKQLYVVAKNGVADPDANPLPAGVIGPEFSDAERYDLIEYLKVHRDLPDTPAGWRPTLCRLDGEML